MVALLLVISVVTPALGGGSSVSKLAKQLNQLKQQVETLSKQQGPPGQQGPQGAQGTQGIQGPGAVKLAYDVPETTSTFTDLGTQNELTVATQCSRDAGAAQIAVFVRSSVPGTIDFTSSIDSGGAPIVSNGGFAVTGADAQVVGMGGGGGIDRALVEGTYWNASRVISVKFTAISDDTNGRCQVHGLLVPAS